MKRQDRYLIFIAAVLGIMFPLWQNMSPFESAPELRPPEKPSNYREYRGFGEYLPDRVRGTSLRAVGESIAEHNLRDVKENIEDQLEHYVHDWGLDLVEDESFKVEENTQNQEGKRRPASLGRIALATPDARVAHGKLGLQVMNTDSVRVRYKGDLDLTCEVKKDQTQVQMKWDW
ncbi:MAG: hypothetical protein AB7O96_15840 [Pseudobdellovibrionaceae bacterium]